MDDPIDTRSPTEPVAPGLRELPPYLVAWQPVRLVRLRGGAERAAPRPGALRACRRLASRPRGGGAGGIGFPRYAQDGATNRDTSVMSFAMGWIGLTILLAYLGALLTCRRRRTSTRDREPPAVNAIRNRSSASSGAPDAQASRPTTPS